MPRKDKICYGFLFVVGLLLIVTGPLLVFSSASPISEPNVVVSASASLSLVAGPSSTGTSNQRDRSRSEYPLATFTRFDLFMLNDNDPLLTTNFRLHLCKDARSEAEAYQHCGYQCDAAPDQTP